MDSRDLPSQEQDNLAGEVLESLGSYAASNDVAEDKGEQEDLPKGVKERLGRQEKRHQKELRNLRAQIEAMQSQMQPNMQQQMQPNMDYNTPVANQYDQGVDMQIQRAVNMALQARDEQDRQGKEREKMQHVQRRYQEMQNHLDGASSKYDDFDDVVRSPDAPFTDAIRDAALLIKNPELRLEVLYKLGKDKNLLKKISELHPLDQASEVIALSHALTSGVEKNNSNRNVMSQVKSMPAVSSQNVTDKTPVSEIRARMKAGKF